MLEFYRDICRGYSQFQYRQDTVTVRHPTLFDQIKFSEIGKSVSSWASNRGIPSQEDRIKQLILQEKWTTQKEKSIKEQESALARILKARDKQYVENQDMLYSAIRSWHSSIDEMRGEIDSHYAERSILVGRCKETHVSDSILDYEISELCDKFTLEDLEENFTEAEVFLIRGHYYKYLVEFGDQTFKKLAVQGFFVSLLDNCIKNTAEFFRKPIVDLTIFQVKMLDYGKRFHEILKHCEGAPPDFYDNPDWLETLALNRINKKSDSSSKKASPEDLKRDLPRR